MYAKCIILNGRLQLFAWFEILKSFIWKLLPPPHQLLFLARWTSLTTWRTNFLTASSSIPWQLHCFFFLFAFFSWVRLALSLNIASSALLLCAAVAQCWLRWQNHPMCLRWTSPHVHVHVHGQLHTLHCPYDSTRHFPILIASCKER